MAFYASSEHRPETRAPRGAKTVRPTLASLQELGPRDENGAPTGASEGRLWDWAYARRGLRLRTLVVLRWVSILGQLLTVLYVHIGLHFQLPLVPCLVVIAIAAWMNLSYGLAWPGSRLTGRWEAVFQLGFDLVEMSVLIGLTGGLSNPFILLLVAPVTVAAATLPVANAAALALLSVISVTILFFFALPLPWAAGQIFETPWLYRFGMWAAAIAGIGFNAAYAWQASAEASRMELALATTQAVLAREQRLSALGGLAAAAAHELGTPLATIQVVTKEMLRNNEPGSELYDDLQLLSTQAERCRDILRRLSHSPEAGDEHHSRLGVSELLEEVADPYRGDEIAITSDVTGAPGAPLLEVKRLPEVLHGLSAFVENAVDFATSSVELIAYYDEDRLIIEVRDDGPGFSPDVIARLGEPYVTTRSQGEASRSNHYGMGLGFFIAKTLLERTGAQVEFRNARQGGALVSVQWPRHMIAAGRTPG
jgi:two-component system sensor histidine kinase RegB